MDLRRKPKTRRPLFGWFLLLTGVVWFLAEADLLPRGVAPWWPLAVTFLAAVGMVRAAIDRRPRAFGSFVTAFLLGAFWAGREQGLLQDRLFPPALLIALGSGLILRRLVPDGT